MMFLAAIGLVPWTTARHEACYGLLAWLEGAQIQEMKLLPGAWSRTWRSFSSRCPVWSCTPFSLDPSDSRSTCFVDYDCPGRCR